MFLHDFDYKTEETSTRASACRELASFVDDLYDVLENKKTDMSVGDLITRITNLSKSIEELSLDVCQTDSLTEITDRAYRLHAMIEMFHEMIIENEERLHDAADCYSWDQDDEDKKHIAFLWSHLNWDGKKDVIAKAILHTKKKDCPATHPGSRLYFTRRSLATKYGLACFDFIENKEN
jgi:hypothetical protein